MRNWSLYSKFHDFEILFSYPTESSSQARSDSPTLNQYYFPPLIIFSSCPVFCHPSNNSDFINKGLFQNMWSPIGITAIRQKERWRIMGVLFCRFFFITIQWAPAIIATKRHEQRELVTLWLPLYRMVWLQEKVFKTCNMPDVSKMAKSAHSV